MKKTLILFSRFVWFYHHWECTVILNEHCFCKCRFSFISDPALEFKVLFSIIIFFHGIAIIFKDCHNHIKLLYHKLFIKLCTVAHNLYSQ